MNVSFGARNRFRPCLHGLLSATCLLLAAGCGGASRGAVNGKVTLDGKPVDGGMISFIPETAEQGKPAWTDIVAGEYSLDVSRGPAVGPNRVEIRWLRKTGRKSPYDPHLDEMREAVPDRYNSDSELRVEVKSGANQFDFKLSE